LFSNTLSLCSSLTVRGHVSHPYRTTGTFVIQTLKIYTEKKNMYFGCINITFVFTKLWNCKYPCKRLRGFNIF
jgi:hypothetical protein